MSSSSYGRQRRRGLLLLALSLGLWQNLFVDPRGPASGRRGELRAAAQEAVIEDEKDQKYLDQLDDDEEGQKEEPLGSPRLFSLAEQWGLLGLLVGLAVAISGIGPQLMDSAVLDFLAFTDALGQAAAQVAAGGNIGDMLGISEPETLSGAAEMAGAAPEVAAAGLAAATGAAGGKAVQAAAAAAGEALGVSALEPVAAVVQAGLFGALGSLAGIVVQGVKEPTKTTSEEGRPSFFVPSATFPKEEKESEGVRPMPGWELAMSNFKREWRMLLRAARFRGSALRRTPRYVDDLVLSNQAVLDREYARPQVPTPPPVRVAYDVLCWFIDVVFEDRPIQRFWFLETVARMPYFAYSSVLHLYETFGWWRSPELRAVHAAEEDNELHHLLIMESLGGDQRWLDRFFAQHGAVAYYWLLVLFFLVDPKWSYNFSRLIEAHAVDTYGEFVDANAERLRKIPPPPIAVEYYLKDENYLFDKMQTSVPAGFKRRPPCATLYDVFSNICDDEEEHVRTMTACEEWSRGGKPPVDVGINFNSKLSKAEYVEKVTQTAAGRAAWVAWGEEVARHAEAGRGQV
ncbi:unnamed protein product [Effrenium voratum]|uniref:Ubiquinol oxidase n=1 Tax=Effrenium voratum TaxID=2562239 RepID=A0AA36HTG9_9DINO|nr:unnamed protein product [Effrenium voratum]